MNNIDRDIIRAILTSKIINNTFFSICPIDEILKLTGGIPPRLIYDRLRALHCVNYADMSQALRLELPRMIQIVIESQPIIVNVEAIMPALDSKMITN